MAYAGPELITLLNFDDTLNMQEELSEFSYRVIDLRNIKGVRLLCQRDTLRQIAKQIQGEAGITFLGRGDFHHISYLLLCRIKRPFTLVLFDNHADIKPCFSLLSCGSWTGAALELPNLRRAIIIGSRGESLLGISPHLLTKVLYFPYLRVPAGLLTRDPCLRNFVYRFPPISLEGMEKTIKRIISLIPTKVVYISIDKDVLRTEDAVTNWEQGQMTLGELLLAIQEIARVKEVCGLDICGEVYFDPLRLPSPRIEKAIKKNVQANIKIVRTLLQPKPLKHAS